MKHKALLVLAICPLLAVAALFLFGSTHVAPAFTARSEVILPASVERSWQVLTHFERYPEWNPYLPKIEGKLLAGEKVNFTLAREKAPKTLDLVTTLGEVATNQRFHWIGRLGIQGIYDTRHGFELRARADGNTDLLHYEEFRGVIPALVKDKEKKIEDLQNDFNRMNVALQQRLERSEDR